MSVCEHGRNKRQCPECLANAEIADLRREIKNLKEMHERILSWPPQDVQRAYTVILQLAASEARRGHGTNGKIVRDAVDSIQKHIAQIQAAHDESRRLRLAENRQTADQITRARKAEAEVIRQGQELAGLKKALADAAMEINCAGPVAHRIRVLKEEHAKHVHELKAEIERLSQS